jgi:hypothetical protein
MNLSFALAGKGLLEEAAWHRLLAAWINDRYPEPVAWGPVELLERDLEPLARIAEAPALLQSRDPCRLVDGVLGVYRHTLPNEGAASSYSDIGVSHPAPARGVRDHGVPAAPSR